MERKEFIYSDILRKQNLFQTVQAANGAIDLTKPCNVKCALKTWNECTEFAPHFSLIAEFFGKYKWWLPVLAVVPTDYTLVCKFYTLT